MATKGIRWDRAPIWGSLVWLLFTTGCFGTRMEQGQWAPLLQSPIGVIVLVPEKRLEFSEPLFRVFWAEVRETYYTFAGIWDPAPALGEPCTRTLQGAFGLRAVPLWKEADPDTYQDLVAAAEAALNAERRPSTARGADRSEFHLEWLYTPPVQYLKAPLPADLRARVRPLGVAFLLELSVAGIAVRWYPGWGNMLSVFVYGRLIRLADGDVLWLRRQSGWSGVGPIAELTRNNFAGLREAYDSAVAKLCSADEIFADFRPN